MPFYFIFLTSMSRCDLDCVNLWNEGSKKSIEERQWELRRNFSVFAICFIEKYVRGKEINKIVKNLKKFVKFKKFRKKGKKTCKSDFEFLSCNFKDSNLNFSIEIFSFKLLILIFMIKMFNNCSLKLFKRHR